MDGPAIVGAILTSNPPKDRSACNCRLLDLGVVRYEELDVLRTVDVINALPVINEAWVRIPLL